MEFITNCWTLTRVGAPVTFSIVHLVITTAWTMILDRSWFPSSNKLIVPLFSNNLTSMLSTCNYYTLNAISIVFWSVTFRITSYENCCDMTVSLFIYRCYIFVFPFKITWAFWMFSKIQCYTVQFSNYIFKRFCFLKISCIMLQF